MKSSLLILNIGVYRGNHLVRICWIPGNLRPLCHRAFVTTQISSYSFHSLCCRLQALGHVRLGELHPHMQNIFNKGDWGQWETCPVGSYAAGMQLMVGLNVYWKCSFSVCTYGGMKNSIIVDFVVSIH